MEGLCVSVHNSLLVPTILTTGLLDKYRQGRASGVAPQEEITLG